MGKSSAARKVSWPMYHPELDGIKGRQAKASMRATANDTSTAAPSIPDQFDSPESSTIASACYDSETQVLSVHFKRKVGPERYDYAPVPVELWREFAQAASKGSFFGARIRPVYAGKKIQRDR